MKTVGQRLKWLRQQKKKTQQEVAKDMHFKNANTVSRYENDERRPDPETLARFAVYYETTTDFITGITDDFKVENQGFQPDLKLFSFRLKQGLETKEISEETAAEACGVKPEYIHKLMYNPDKLPGVSTLYKLADLLDVTPDYLGGFVDDPQGRSPHTPKPKELTEFLNNENVMFHGVPLTDEDKQKIENVLIGLFWESKQMNKRKKK
ncbi:Transcriptional regulator, contains XRE-family HTH domain [Aneurinibacillus thermoaerophilus]|uniref:Transcriptional regulator, contains XRE-family HTH domain n=1 Tax=Aneurinibacillus thermoaerophilus TaxID=143495 RepID=A0A1G8EIF1_ANETH|nr:helix-turn-helix transcriptional regulator [Aneurinibacillus thermoaerophilus]SDH69647.1 Transcriptional regulator, contains XRE-family HTH domain [Aneurinibacillus thermoaerophilus]